MGAETTPLLIAVLTVGVALAGLMIGLFAWLRQDIKELRHGMGDLRERMARVEGNVARLEGNVARLDSRLAHLDGRLAHLEGTVDVLRKEVAGGDRRIAAE